jgi:hypothetical protein
MFTAYPHSFERGVNWVAIGNAREFLPNLIAQSVVRYVSFAWFVSQV